MTPHERINRVLTTVALLLGIVIMLAVIWYGAHAINAFGAFRDEINNMPVVDSPEEFVPGTCYDPGAGVVCDESDSGVLE